MLIFSRNKNKIKIFAVIGVIFALVNFRAVPVFADAAQDALAAQKLQDQQKLQLLNQQISDLQNQINGTEKQQSTLRNTLALYDTQIRQTQIEIQAAQTNIDNTNVEIQQTQIEITQKTQQLEQQRVVLGDLLTTLDEDQNSSKLQLALGSGTFSDFLDQVQYTTTVENKVYDLVEQVKTLKSKLEQDQTTLQKNLTALQDQQQSLQQTQSTLADQRTAQEQILSQTKGKESNYQKLLTTTQDQQAKIDQEINNLDAKIQGKTGFNALQPVHGILAYPVQGVLTQGYGNTGFTQLGYNFHNGIDLAGPAGAPISAAADGVVYAVGHGEAAYGNWVVIKHDIVAAGGHQIMTLYGHMRSFVVSPGQVVKTGDLVGYEGNTGNTTRLLCNCPDRGYHLHFSVFDATDFGIAAGAYPNIYGPYQVPYGYTYNPLDFL